MVFGKLVKLVASVGLATDDKRRPVIFVRPDFRGAFLVSFNEISVLAVTPLTKRDIHYWMSHCPGASAAAALEKCLALQGSEHFEKPLNERRSHKKVLRKARSESPLRGIQGPPQPSLSLG